MSKHQRFAWAFAAYLIAVILFGAWVRIAGAGAGCGNHWPLCNGEVLPAAPQTKTVIEFTHRITSALCGVFGLAMIWFTSGRARKAAILTMFFILVEGFVGAVLVKMELVENDASLSRAIVIALHLTNTLLLMACATAIAVPPAQYGDRRGKRLVMAVLCALVLINMTGAVTALGDTIFPVKPALDGGLWSKIRDDATAGQHFLIRLRAVHPFLAIAGAGFLIGGMAALRRRVREVSHWPVSLAGTQVLLGAANIALAAPGWMQVIHLLVAQLLWVACVKVWLEMRA